MKKTVLSLLLCLCMLLSLLPPAVAMEETMTAGGWNESLWVELPGIADQDVTAVTYTGPVSGSLTGDDFVYLVRDQGDLVRIDIPGLPAGKYTLTVTTTQGDFAWEDLTVTAYDRSGYAHFGYTEGVGAYGDDGVLKENAIVLYVTDANKDTVTVTSKDGTTVSGIGNILNSRGRSSNNGSMTNTNQDILRKLALDGTPLVVRIIGNVSLPYGLTAYNSTDFGGSVGDNGAMARMQGGKNITIEGIGVGAAIDGWGLHFICSSGDYAQGLGQSFEVRNISFRNVPEDCVGMEGEQSGSTLSAPVQRCWIHHCAFYAPSIAKPAESDKSGGDGACDFKRGLYFTNSYCYYEGYHKTNLVGASDSNQQYHITYHHNYWKNCESRGPLARQANIHMYNNIFENQSSYCMNPRADAYIFSEYNLFLNSKNPVRVNQGAVKSYGDVFTNCRGDNHATLVTDKTTKVDTACRYANFDTDATLSYIPSGNYLLQESISAMQAVVQSQAGNQGRGIQVPQPDVGGGDSGEPDQGGGSDVTIEPGSYTHNFTTQGKTSEFFTINGNLSTGKGSTSFDGMDLTQCLKMETATSIEFTAPVSGTLVLIFGGSTSAAGKSVKVDNVRQTIGNDQVLTMQVAAGNHTITKGDSINLFFMAYTSQEEQPQPHVHSYAETVVAADCVRDGSKTYTCQCGEHYSQVIPATGHSLTTTENMPSCTVAAEVITACMFCDFVEIQILPATGHDFQNGFCVYCNAQDPTAPTEPAPTEPAPTEPAPTEPAPTEPAPTEPAPTQPATQTQATTAAPATSAPAQTGSQSAADHGNNSWIIYLALAAAALGVICGLLAGRKKK